MNQNDIHQFIQAYEDGTLSKKDRLDFEKQLKTNAMLAKAWQLHQEVDRSISNPKALEMEILLEDIGNEFAEKYQSKHIEQQKLKRSRIRPMYLWTVAATIALVLGFVWWQLSAAPIDHQELYIAAYEPYSSSITIRSSSGATDTAFQQGQKKYQIGEYEAAITFFSTVLESDSLTTEAIIATRFYKGIAHIGEEQFGLAKKELERVLATSGHVYTQQAQWYLALIALKNKEVATAKDALKKTMEMSKTGKYRQKAVNLLEQLE